MLKTPFKRINYSSFLIPNSAFEEQIDLKNMIYDFNEYAKPKNRNKKKKNYWLMNTEIDLLKDDKKSLMVLKAYYYQ